MPSELFPHNNVSGIVRKRLGKNVLISGGEIL